MIKVKNRSSVFIEDNGILIRSIKSEDMSYYVDWFAKQFTDGFIESEPKERVYKMISKKISTGSTLIIEVNKQPIGEIYFYLNKDIKIKNEKIEEPIYNISISEFAKDIIYDRYKLINLLLQKDKNILLQKIKTIITVIDHASNGFLEEYKMNGFNTVQQNLITSKLDKYFAKMGIDNPYQKNILLLKRM